MEDFNNKMTIYYSKITQEVRCYCSGIQDMKFFYNEEEEMKLIYDFMVVDKDEYVMSNLHKFKVIDGRLHLKDEILENISKYL